MVGRGMKVLGLCYIILVHMTGVNCTGCLTEDDPCIDNIARDVPGLDSRCPECQFAQSNGCNLHDLSILDDFVWYKSNTIMTTDCVIPYGCGTKYPIWLNGSIPTPSMGTVRLKSCLSTFADCCYTTYDLYVKTCKSFFTFCLVDLPSSTCPQRYCFDNETVTAVDGTTIASQLTSGPTEEAMTSTTTSTSSEATTLSNKSGRTTHTKKASPDATDSTISSNTNKITTEICKICTTDSEAEMASVSQQQTAACNEQLYMIAMVVSVGVLSLTYIFTLVVFYLCFRRRDATAGRSRIMVNSVIKKSPDQTYDSLDNVVEKCKPTLKESTSVPNVYAEAQNGMAQLVQPESTKVVYDDVGPEQAGTMEKDDKIESRKDNQYIPMDGTGFTSTGAVQRAVENTYESIPEDKKNMLNSQRSRKETEKALPDDDAYLHPTGKLTTVKFSKK